jgi:hypothetical protein
MADAQDNDQDDDKGKDQGPPKPPFRLPDGCRPGLGSAAFAVALLGAYLVYLFGLPDIYFWRSPGRIYVESPEVYTRERLVNDRYLQASWLSEKLTAVEKATFRKTTISSHMTVSLGASATRENDPTETATEENPEGENDAKIASGAQVVSTPPGDFPFDIDYDLKTAMRDKIRQDIIENMLDDRHDLTGNSLVAMKFDTTVLKRRGARYNARVAFRITAAKLFSPTATTTAGDEIEPSVEAHLVDAFYFSKGSSNILTNQLHPLYRSYLQYDQWLKNIEHRMNRELLRSCTRLVGSSGTQTLQLNLAAINRTNVRAIFRENLSKVLSITSDFDFPETKLAAVPLPAPWSDVFTLQYSSNLIEETNCSTVRFRVLPLTATIYVMDAASQEELGDLIVRLTAGDSSHVMILVDDMRVYFTSKIKSALTTDPLPPLIYGLAGQIYEVFVSRQTPSIFHQPNAGQMCIASSRPDEKQPVPATESGTVVASLKTFCPPEAIFPKAGTLSSIFFPAGYFAFMKKVERSDSYLYSLIPNGSSTARVLSRSASLRLGMDNAGGRSGIGGMLDHTQDSSAFDTEPEVLTFGMAGPADEIEFGWIAVADTRQSGPESFSQTALLSVPAWADEIEAQVITSWVDDSGNVVFEDPPRDFKIPLPPDYEIFDAFISDGATYRRPNIDEDNFGSGLLLRNGKPGSIIIPGARLWRSTVVTLGSQKADEIFVLPDMEGVIATFRTVDTFFDDFTDCKVLLKPTLDTVQAVSTETATTPAAETRRCVKTLPLRVWTSEGMDEVGDKVTVVDIQDNPVATMSVALPSTDTAAAAE